MTRYESQIKRMKTGPAFPLTRDDGLTVRRLLGGLMALAGFVWAFWVLAAAGF